ncbi:MAG: 2-phospho-L-lactate/phosphoenolpyruvate guanylyltransferase, partial [Frankiaceae bacterium]|nr:2-phospho-L-lactate/phosphoenolpyruvate guanylyltransferase [Frankiaceae bacterium]
MDWVAVVPVKALPEAKSRLDREDRADLALAMATDTVAAAAACDAVSAVVVVTDDRRVRDALEPLATVVPDEPD